MTQPIVPSITDDVIAEIESSAKRVTLGGIGWYTELQLDDAIASSDDIDYITKMTPDAALRLITRLRAAEKDAARYRWLRQFTVKSYPVQGALKRLDREIDAAMERVR